MQLDTIPWFLRFAQSRRATMWAISIGFLLTIATAGMVYVTQSPLYRTHAVFPLISKARTAFGTEEFLQYIIRQQPGLRDAEAASVSRLRRHLGVPRELDRNSAIYKVEMLWENPEELKSLMTLIVNESLALSRPFGSELNRRIEEIQALENNISNLRILLSRLSLNMKSGAIIDDTPSTLHNVENDIAQKEELLKFLRRSLEGVSAEDVLEWPPPPTKQEGKTARAAIAAIAALLLMGLSCYLPRPFSAPPSRRF